MTPPTATSIHCPSCGRHEDSLVLTVEEAGALLRLSRNGVYKAVKEGQIPSLRIGKRLLVSRVRLEAMLAGEGE